MEKPGSIVSIQVIWLSTSFGFTCEVCETVSWKALIECIDIAVHLSSNLGTLILPFGN